MTGVKVLTGASSVTPIITDLNEEVITSDAMDRIAEKRLRSSNFC